MRRPISQEYLPARCSMVRQPIRPVRPPSFQSIIQGIAIILFFRCMSALLNPFNRTSGGIKWLLVTHTVAIFLFVTVFTGINLNILSISYIDNRKFRGTTEPPGPAGFQYITYSTTISVVSTCMFLLNNLLVDGLLVRFAFESVTRLSNVGRSSSSTVATLCTQ